MPDCRLEVSGHLKWPDVGELEKVCGFPESCSKCWVGTYTSRYSTYLSCDPLYVNIKFRS